MGIQHKPVIQLFMPNAGEQGVVYAWVAGTPDVKEFRGNPLSRWGRDETSDFRKMVEALNAMHLSDLRTSHIITVLPNQRDHGAVLSLMDSTLGSVSVGYGHPRVRQRVSTSGRASAPRSVETRLMRPRAPAPRVITLSRPEARVN